MRAIDSISRRGKLTCGRKGIERIYDKGSLDHCNVYNTICCGVLVMMMRIMTMHCSLRDCDCGACTVSLL